MAKAALMSRESIPSVYQKIGIVEGRSVTTRRMGMFRGPKGLDSASYKKGALVGKGLPPSHVPGDGESETDPLFWGSRA